MSTVFTYNQNLAVKAGQAGFISETGAYMGRITKALWGQSQSGAKYLDLSIETDDGLKADYLNVYYTSKNGEPISFGENMIQAIMGCLGIQQLTAVNTGQAITVPELQNKRIGLFLQKVLRLKQDGSDTHTLQIVVPFSANSGKTLLEHLENKPAQRVEWLKANTKDKDERSKQNAPQANYQAQNEFYGNAPAQPNNSFDDDIPF